MKFFQYFNFYFQIILLIGVMFTLNYISNNYGEKEMPLMLAGFFVGVYQLSSSILYVLYTAKKSHTAIHLIVSLLYLMGLALHCNLEFRLFPGSLGEIILWVPPIALAIYSRGISFIQFNPYLKK